MSSAEKTINLEFGLSQLSGNKTLFLRLLQKFADEYQQASDKLQSMVDNQQWQEARLYAHTIKGVASNLGFTRLHLACKETEAELKADAAAPVSLPELKTAMDETLALLAALQANPALLDNPQTAFSIDPSADVAPVAEAAKEQSAVAPASDAASSAPADNASLAAPEAFIRALEQSEFIAQDQLDNWLDQTTSDNALQQTLRDAIDELDYDTALDLLRAP